jgi:hypothetical protein
MVEQVLDLLDLHPHAAVDPRLRDQVFVLGGQVDRIDHLALLVEQAAGAGEEDDLVRLQHLHQLVGGEIGVDVEDLAAGGFAELAMTGIEPARRLASIGARLTDFAHQTVASRSR